MAASACGAHPAFRLGCSRPIPCHDANILLRRRLAPAGGSRCKFRFDLGGDVAEVRRHCAKLEARSLLLLVAVAFACNGSVRNMARLSSRTQCD